MAAATPNTPRTPESTAAATTTTRTQTEPSLPRNVPMEDKPLQQQQQQHEQQDTSTATTKQHRRNSTDNKKKDRNINRRMESIQILQGYLLQQHHQQQSQQQQQKQQSLHKQNDPSVLHPAPTFTNDDCITHATKNTIAANSKNRINARDIETDQLLNDILFQTTATTVSLNGRSNGSAGSPDLNHLMFTSIGSTSSFTNCNYNQLIFQSMGSMQHEFHITNSPTTTTTDYNINKAIANVVKNNSNYGSQNHVVPEEQLQQPMTIPLSKNTSSSAINSDNTTSFNKEQQRSLSISSIGNNNSYFNSSAWKPMLQPHHIELMAYPPDHLFFETTGSTITTTTAPHSNAVVTSPTDTLLLAAQHVLQDKKEDDSTPSTVAVVNGYKHDKNPTTAFKQNTDQEAAVEMVKASIKTRISIIKQDQELFIKRRRPSDQTSTIKAPEKTSKRKLKNHVVDSHIKINDTTVEPPPISFNDSLQLRLQQQQQQLTGVVDGRIVPLISNLEVTNDDVLLGRGGRTNHHIGNRTYRTLKEELQTTYLQATKDEKTVIANQLVQKIHDANGRFLKEFTGTPLPSTSTTVNNPVIVSTTLLYWYEVDLLTARKKASQTLREINTPENRLAKRLKYKSK